MHALIQAHKPEVRILLLSLIAGVAAFGWMFARTQSTHLSLVRLTGDASGYVSLAENIIEHHVFSFSHQPPFVPDSFRTPGYPLLLAAFYSILRSWLAVLIAQLLLVSSAPLLLYVLLRPYGERAARWASYIFIFEPVRLFLSSSLLSDAAFLCLFLLSLIFLDRGVRGASPERIAISGGLLGWSILMRPIAMFLPILYIGYIVLLLRPKRRAMEASLALTLAAAILVVPWMVRNHQLFGSWQLSSVGAANLMIYNAPAYLAYHPDTRGQNILDSFHSKQAALPPLEALSLAHSADFTQSFREIIRGHELSYVVFHVLKTAPFFVTDGLRDTIRLFNIDIGKMPNITTALLTGNSSLVATYILHGGLPIALLLAGVGFWSAITLLFLFSLVGVVRRAKREPMVLLCMMLVFYFALLTGPVSSARYRLPVEGFLLAGAAYTLTRKSTSVHESQSA